MVNPETSTSRNASPTTTVSSLSADSGLASEEELPSPLSCPPSSLSSLSLQHSDDSDDSQDSPLYENLSFQCDQGPLSLPPPSQFSDPSPNRRRLWDSQFGEALIEEEEEEEDEGADLSILLTSQNPARIDVRTLRNKKVITEE